MNVVVFLAGLIATLGLAAIYGGKPERWVAGMFAVATIASHLLYTGPTQRYHATELSVAVVDLALLAGITIVLAKADRFWPIALFAIHGVTVLAHIVKLLDTTIVKQAYAIAIAAPSYLAIATLTAGVIRHQRRLQQFGADLDWSQDAQP